MARKRVKEYIDLPLKNPEMIKIKKGYRVVKKVKDTWLSIYMDGKDRKKEREILKLKARIKQLEGKKK